MATLGISIKDANLKARFATLADSLGGTQEDLIKQMIEEQEKNDLSGPVAKDMKRIDKSLRVVSGIVSGFFLATTQEKETAVAAALKSLDAVKSRENDLLQQLKTAKSDFLSVEEELLKIKSDLSQAIDARIAVDALADMRSEREADLRTKVEGLNAELVARLAEIESLGGVADEKIKIEKKFWEIKSENEKLEMKVDQMAAQGIAFSDAIEKHKLEKKKLLERSLELETDIATHRGLLQGKDQTITTLQRQIESSQCQLESANKMLGLAQNSLAAELSAQKKKTTTTPKQQSLPEPD